MEPKGKTSGKNGILVILGIILLAAIIGYVWRYVVIPNQQYQQAVALFEAEDYEEAGLGFQSLGSFKDSETMAMECQYGLASALLSAGKFSDAEESFIQLGNYKDSAEMVLESQYRLALFKAEEKDYKAAADIFSNIIDYKDSAENIKKCKYDMALFHMEKGQHQSAIDLLKELDDYSDSKDMLTSAQYSLAKESITRAKYVEAKRLLTEIGDYNDSLELLKNADYYIYADMYLGGDLNGAKKGFEAIGDYKDSKEFLKKIEVINKFQGTWARGMWLMDGSFYEIGGPVIIKGLDMNVVSNHTSGTSVYKYTCTLEDDKLVRDKSDYRPYYYSINSKGELVETSGNYQSILIKKSNSTNVPAAYSKPSPQIGMTASEVRSSSWGSPESVNRTTTKYGVTEQWVYSGYRYIYLDDGIVTAIQD